MKDDSFSNPSDFENPYKPPEAEGTQTADTIIKARPMVALLLTTFAGGAFVLLFFAGALITFGSLNDLRAASTSIVPAYTCWTVFPGLVSGLISRQISLGRSTSRELILVAGVILVPGFIVIVYANGASSTSLEFSAFASLSFVFQFWLASFIGRFCSGRE